ncbi:hypothetical protein FDP41_002634 [Naegleria fowleri]|uniref:Uncharacterized protein n=1 Tax=Naegleria fowleri TaxID=5763 RepID=A0A6A5BYV2_NAEFO|nr:uncharacterized protein FDP41_002634 [Naegleria fowleri]KAF0978119.1 hypothetical protein FDP41_002634 [Naegleria fowleri]CAG4716332.1 unnamed protein product [Naegleria fowleri]
MQNINASFLPPSQYVLPHQQEKEPHNKIVDESSTTTTLEYVPNHINSSSQIESTEPSIYLMSSGDRDSHQEPPPPPDQIDENEIEEGINVFESPLEQDISKEWPLVKHEVESMWQELIVLCTQIRAGHLTADTVLSLYKFIALLTVFILTIVISWEVIQSSRNMQ